MTDDEILKVEELIGRVKYLEDKIKEIENYVNKMSYQEIVNNPKSDLIKILKKENK